MKKITVLLTGVGAPGAHGIIQCYRKADKHEIKIIGVDMNENCAGRTMVDAFYTVPAAKDESFIFSILEICKKEKVDIVVPIVTRELMKFSMARDLFREIGTKVSVLEKDILEIVNDKGHLFDAMRDHNIVTPRYRLVNNVPDMLDAVKEMGYPDMPVCVKITNGNGSRGVRMIDLPENNYERFFNDKPNSAFISYESFKQIFEGKDAGIPCMMVMEYLPGKEYSVDVIAEKDMISAMVCRHGTKVVSSIQIECVVERNEKIEALCGDVINKLGIIGEFGFDIKCDKNEKPYIIEINPRLTAGIVACAAAGCNIPYFELLRSIDKQIPPYSINYGTVMSRHWVESFIDSYGRKIIWGD